jgi:ATP-dependent Lon protease
MESPQHYAFRNEFLNRTVFTTINKVRQSYNEGLLSPTSYQSAMTEACQLRDNFTNKTNLEIESSLKELVEKVGTWSFREMIELYLGPYYQDHFDVETQEMLEFYEQAFHPNVCMPGPNLLEVVGPVARGTNFEGIIEPASINFVGSKGAGGTKSGISTGCLMIFSDDQTICVLGNYVKDTPEYYCKQYTMLGKRRDEVIRRVKLPNSFTSDYIANMALCDFITMRVEQLIMHIDEAHKQSKDYVKMTVRKLEKEFSKADAREKREILTLLLMSDSQASSIPKLVKSCCPEEFNELYSSLHLDLQKKVKNYQAVGKLNEVMGKRKRRREPNKPSLEDRIEKSGAPQVGINKALQKLRAMKSSRDGDPKAEKYINGFLDIPFGVYQEEVILKNTKRLIDRGEKLRKRLKIQMDKITKESMFRNLLKHAEKVTKSKRSVTKFRKDALIHRKEKQRYLASARKTMDRAVHGHHEAKNQIERVLAQWLNGEQRGTILGLQGPPGNGKTSLIQEGLAKCLKDSKGKSHPFVFIPLGGLTGGSSLLGHSFTYVGSIWGRIADGLMQSKCMNPIFYFDELDKVSNTERGQEIISVLTHLTDSTQNQKFFDEYFQGVPLDLSRATFVFTFNNINRVDRVLRDRIHIIKTKPLQLPEKQIIAQKYLLPKIVDEIGFGPEDIKFTNDQIRTIVEDYTMEAGVRKLKEILYDVVRETNRHVIDERFELPVTLTDEFMQEVLKRKHRINHDTVHSKPQVGVMNGMYASSIGLGGITKIEVSKTHANNSVLDLKLTGNQGDIMKESMACAKTVAWNHLTKKEQVDVNKNEFALHVHCPSGATPKDGPSAGGAITLAIISTLKNVPLPNDIAMTGEIDLHGNITEIGGLSEKLLGAKKAGVKRAFVPKDNARDLKRIYDDDLLSRDDPDFTVTTVEHISEMTEQLF